MDTGRVRNVSSDKHAWSERRVSVAKRQASSIIIQSAGMDEWPQALKKGRKGPKTTTKDISSQVRLATRILGELTHICDVIAWEYTYLAWPVTSRKTRNVSARIDSAQKLPAEKGVNDIQKYTIRSSYFDLDMPCQVRLLSNNAITVQCIGYKFINKWSKHFKRLFSSKFVLIFSNIYI